MHNTSFRLKKKVSSWTGYSFIEMSGVDIQNGWVGNFHSFRNNESEQHAGSIQTGN